MFYAHYVRNDDLRIFAGDDRPIVWPLGVADLTGYTAVAQARSEPSSEVVLQEWNTDDDSILLADSSLSLIVDGSDTWEWTNGVYDVHLIDPIGRHEIIAWGRILVHPGVTR